MKHNRDRAIAEILRHEGGFVDHPKDPGGATNRGVTQRVYDAFRRRRGLAPRSVRAIEDAETLAIYIEQYWHPIRGDDLPAGLDLAVFDFAVNSGVSRASKHLQRRLGVAADGIVGEVTLGAIPPGSAATADLIVGLCDGRLAFLKSLPTWDTFGRGWERRVREVKATAAAWVSESRPDPDPAPAGGIVALILRLVAALFPRRAA